MSEKDNVLLSEISSQIKKAGLQLKGLYLFGSRAAHKHNETSDYDVAIILDEKIDWKLKDKVREVIYDLMLDYDIVIDSHIYTEIEIDLPTTPLRQNIKSSGIYYAG